jgi:hypothetical protein
MKTQEFDLKMKRFLHQKPAVSPQLESTLFSHAEELLAVRRERKVLVRETVRRFRDFLLIRPDTPAAAGIFAALVLTFLALHVQRDHRLNGHVGIGQVGSGRTEELASFPSQNDASARYDAQVLAERIAYEKEVEDAHEKTSGGI